MIANYECVIDAHAWIEYFAGSSSGQKAGEFIQRGSAATSVASLAELQHKYLMEKWLSFDADLKFLSTKTSVIPIDKEISLLAGQINYANKKNIKGWGMIDSIILATARTLSTKVITGDPHFKNLRDAIII